MIKLALCIAGGVIVVNMLAPNLWRDLQYAAGEMAGRAAVRAGRTGGVLDSPFAQGAVNGMADATGNATLRDIVSTLLPVQVEGT